MAVVANHHQIDLNSTDHRLQPNTTLIPSRPIIARPSTSSSRTPLPSSTLDLPSPSTSSIQKSIQAFSLTSNLDSNPSKGKLWQQALENPIKFIKSSSDQLSQSQFPYIPINIPTQPSIQRPKITNHTIAPLPSTSSQAQTHPSDTPSASTQSTSKIIVTSWIRPQAIGPGFYNTGNTCFLNATLQVLVHTPALVIGLMDREEHGPNSCRLGRDKKFCGLCRMYRLVDMCFDKTCQAHAIEPTPISRALSKFAPTMRGSRQEDAHEFLRLLIEAMQNGALEGRAEKAKQKQKEATFIHRMFGGKLRSRVVCEHCNTASDTFENFLDLSLDISQANSVSSALKAYHKFDRLRGANQYKCDHCKCLRDARKSMSVFSAPPILTLHLKRFNFRGQKINKRVNFEDSLDLRPAMSDESGPTGYKLYGVVCHRGQSNKRGHYYAHVKASNGKWYLADDSSIESIAERSVMANDHAYMLFYARDRESLLSAVIAGKQPSSSMSDQSSTETGRFVKRKPSLSYDSSISNPRSNATNKKSSNANDQEMNENKRARMCTATPNEDSTTHLGGVSIPRHLLPTFKRTHHDQPSPDDPTDPPEQDNQEAPLLSPSLSRHEQSKDLDDGHDVDTTGDVEQPQLEQPQLSLSKRNKRRRQKLKNRRLVNMAGVHVNIKPRVI